MQTVAEMWLLVHLTGSGLGVGIAAALQFLPMLLFGAMGGVLADRRDRRRLLMVTQTLMAIPAVTLWLLTAGGVVDVWMVYALILIRGTVNAIDNPARQSFVTEMVGPDLVVNAVSLNSVIVQTARIVGPALAGITIALTGVGTCFAINALSFAAMFIALRRMDPHLLHREKRAERAGGQIRAAVREVVRRPELRIPLGMMVVIGTFSFNFQVLLPLLARFTWHGTAGTYALLTSAMGAGSVLGALASGARGRTGPGLLTAAAVLFGVAQLLAAAAPSLVWQVAVLVPLGMASVTFAAGVNSSLQLSAGPELRGRVMALYSVVFLGSTPIGAPLVGWLAGAAGPRAGLLLGGVAALATAAGARIAYARAGALPLPDGQRALDQLGVVARGVAGADRGRVPALAQDLGSDGDGAFAGAEALDDGLERVLAAAPPDRDGDRRRLREPEAQPRHALQGREPQRAQDGRHAVDRDRGRRRGAAARVRRRALR
jgi:MFS family permease